MCDDVMCVGLCVREAGVGARVESRRSWSAVKYDVVEYDDV